jgi:hypothetical protein
MKIILGTLLACINLILFVALLMLAGILQLFVIIPLALFYTTLEYWKRKQ